MPDDVFQRGARMLERVRVANLSHEVVYRRGNDEITVGATVDQSTVETVVEGFAGVVDRMKDFLFARADLVIDETPIDPTAGDEIEETIDGDTVTYEVMRPNGSPAWEFDDSMNLRVRVHTRRKT
jgi:hypothetical protein